MFLRLFAPVASRRLFDPMPLPRRLRLQGRVGRMRAALPATARLRPVVLKIKKIPYNR